MHTDFRRGVRYWTDVRHWPGMRSEYNWISPGGGVTRTKPNQVGVAFSRHVAAVYEFGGRTVQSDIADGSVFVTGQDPITWTRIQETTEALEIYLDMDWPTVEPATARYDGTVLAVASILKRAHTAGAVVTDVEASTLACLLARHVGARYGGTGNEARPAAGRLSRKTVDRIAEFVDGELASELTLARLAAVARLSPFHFARAFKATTGLAPHQFVTARRMDRATTLLVGSDASVPEVAYAVGLSNVGHFRRLYRSHAGVLPGEVRREERGELR
jgi:AraC family transcriptional regulator